MKLKYYSFKSPLIFLITFFFLVLSSFILLAQTLTLKPSIGISALPNDADAICTIPVYLDPDGSFETPGPQVGDTIPDFTLYDLNGDSINMKTELLKGKHPSRNATDSFVGLVVIRS